MKKTVLFIVATALVSLSSTSSFAYTNQHSQYGNTQAEAAAKAMAVCKRRAKKPQRCRLVKITTAAGGKFHALVLSD